MQNVGQSACKSDFQRRVDSHVGQIPLGLPHKEKSEAKWATKHQMSPQEEQKKTLVPLC